MNKSYYKKLSNRRFLHNLQRKRWRKAYRYAKLLKRLDDKRINNQNKKNKKYFKVNVPRIFSLEKNHEETLQFYTTLDSAVRNGYRIDLDMSDVEVLEPHCLLYLLSRLDYYKTTLKFFYMTGNSPRKRIPNEMLTSSGFFNYVRVKNSFANISNDNILEIMSGTIVDEAKALKIREFASSKLGDMSVMVKQGIYSTVIECMANTNNHAYKSSTTLPKNISTNKWWVMAHCATANEEDESRRQVKFIFLDNGRGIPQTILPKFKGLFFNNDGEVLELAFNGKYKSSTKHNWRGKGLPKIYKLFKSHYIENLSVISNNGRFIANNSITKKLQDKFHGTMLMWDFKKQNQITGLLDD
ncbi:hypothetical protein [Halobacteriovorax sp.]|uniref:hypothetical protein n=1 Tax=Halobacteriovorax sp. TaxID=2020862 RepID=UPI003AF21FAC